jgi:AraC-like DNA-binding protein
MKRATRPLPDDSRGVVDPGRLLERVRFERHPPSPAVTRFVDWYWTVEWALPDGEVHEQGVLAHPVVNLVLEGPGADVYGVQHRRQVRRLAGTASALGVMFRPAGFRAFSDVPLSSLTDRSVPAATLFGDEVDALAARQHREGPSPAVVAAVDALIAARAPCTRQPCEDTTRLVEAAAADRSIRRAADLAVHAGVSLRQLQRVFADHVGASPKWVIRRYRLYDIAERAVRTERTDWAALAAELGYADQAHLVRDFTAAFGVSPQRYAERALRIAPGRAGGDVTDRATSSRAQGVDRARLRSGG